MIWKKFAGIAALIAASSAYVQAQQSEHIVLAGSAGIPVGTLSKQTQTGPGFMAGLILGSNTSMLGVRFDFENHDFHGRDTAGVRGPDIHVSSVTANLLGTVTIGPVKPYLIGGFGWYPYRLPDDDKSHTHWGLNGGGGLTIPFLSRAIFIEARYHRVYGGEIVQNYVPINVGFVL